MLAQKFIEAVGIEPKSATLNKGVLSFYPVFEFEVKNGKPNYITVELFSIFGIEVSNFNTNETYNSIEEAAEHVRNVVLHISKE